MERKRVKEQINKLLLLDGMGNLMLASASWVALLSARGFSTVEIGAAESVFHTASMIFEIPSGAMADVFGRRKILIASRAAALLAAVLMIYSNSLLSVMAVMILSALSYNLASGTREALAYDSLKEVGSEDEYDKFASDDMVIYQLTSSLAVLMAGVVLRLGYKKAYMIDVIAGMITLIMAFTLREAFVNTKRNVNISKCFSDVFSESAAFICKNRKVQIIIFFNAVIGAISVLILFFLQAKLPEIGLSKLLLGPALFFMGLGAVLGAKIVVRFKNSRYKSICLISVVGIAAAMLSLISQNCLIVIAGGFAGAFADNFLEVRTDILLNSMIPSEQRATLISVNSFVFSMIMIVLSPIFGIIFS